MDMIQKTAAQIIDILEVRLIDEREASGEAEEVNSTPSVSSRAVLLNT
jgi:hypothetical protein